MLDFKKKQRARETKEVVTIDVDAALYDKWSLMIIQLCTFSALVP